MLNKCLLGSILALCVGTGPARAQIALGNTVTPENNFESGYGPYAPALYSADCRSDCKPPSHPFLGHVARTSVTPICAAVGLLMPPRCGEPPTKEEVARMIVDGGYSPAEITAAKIQIDEAQASARRAAVRYLATIDWHYFPEAESALIAAMRADRVEMVRHEAAFALGNCRALTEKTLEALNMTALGLELDGNPAESSERVRSAARSSLHRCSSRGLCLPPPDPQVAPTVAWLAPDPFTIQTTGYYVPTYVPVAAPIPQHERELAETISANPKTTSSLNGSRSLWHFLLGFTSGRESAPDTRKNLDPRLRGLRPLGSETTLAIPTTPSYPVTIAPIPPYNYQE
jgi:PBS lyase HEAT-like repeat